MDRKWIISGLGILIGSIAAGHFIAKKLNLTKKTTALSGVPKNEFGWLMRDLSLAIRKKDCRKALKTLKEARLEAKTTKQKKALLKAYNKVNRCLA